MKHAQEATHRHPGSKLIDFDQALLQYCDERERRDLETEADLLATAFADGRRSLYEIAWTVTRTAPPRGRGGLRARRLAAVLRLRAKYGAG